MNRVQLIGVLVWPVEVHHDRTTGQTVGKAMIAVSCGVNDLHFVPVRVLGREAIDAANHLGEGSRVDIKGHLRSVLVTDQDATGTTRRRRMVYVVADRITYLTVQPPRGGDRQPYPEDRQ